MRAYETPINEEADIQQSIREILTTPQGDRATRPEFGFPCLERTGVPRSGLTEAEVRETAMAALNTYEPRISVGKIAVYWSSSNRLIDIIIVYTVTATGKRHTTAVFYPNDEPEADWK
ncbi:MAG TPA: GPW/gp25 family protein [Pseudorhizobium sp.]|jgi:phage baseplate assembly protein W|nr:GPW/gp25 family protein [Pseudorhizobium sp.]